MKDKRKLKHSLQWNVLSSLNRKFLSGQDGEPTEQLLAYSTPQDEPTVMTTQHSVNIMVFGVIISDANIMPLFIFPYDLRLKDVVLNWIERDATRRLFVWQQGFKPENPIFFVRKFLQPLQSKHLAAKIPFIILCGEKLSKRPKKLCKIPKMNRRHHNGSITKETTGKVSSRFRSCPKLVLKVNRDFFE